MENTYNYVCEIKREDGVTIRLHFSSGGITCRNVWCVFWKNISKNQRKVEKLDSICYYIIANTVSYLFGRKEKP